MTDNGIYILGAARTPIGKMMGSMATIPATQLGAVAIKAAIERAAVDPQGIDEVIMGQVIQAGAGQAPARQASIAAGIPTSANATTLNKVCASGLEAINQAAHSIRAGDSSMVIAGGMESMSQGPHLLPKARFGYRMGPTTLQDSVVYDGLWSPWDDHHMGMSAEAIAERRGITREEQDECSLRSHQRAVAATNEGRFKTEIVPVEVPGGRGATTRVEKDEGPRPETTGEALARLQPAFTPSGTVTAGNAPGFTDGAAAVVVAGADRLDGSKPLARIVGYASAATDPLWLFEAPELALKKLFDKTRTSVADWDLLEINEAFAAQIVANGKALGWDWERVNVNGGAIALGHPLGATGARLVVTLLHALKQRGLSRGIAGLCHGGGGAVAMAFELV
ncbi:MAG TPA: acetyl-CoA C-acyltransferase [Chloroflexota bacterium]|nr:MAG: acetyl-CoA C-acyltransferase [Chloroflexota bacterium]HTD79604.1 acetyl-CoA C-acyltransferase [Chloroflexota bacterium]